LVETHGTVEPGFEAVREVFAEQDLGVGGGAFAAYVEGVQVADLWGGDAIPGTPWREETRTTGMSATKGVAAACVLVLHARGLVDVDAPVSKYWPEYAQAGKESTLVRHVLNHTSGLLCFQDPGSLLDWEGNGWDDYDGIAQRIAESPPAWQPGTRIGYHAISVGWLLQELVRRITGVTLGEFLEREIVLPLGLQMRIGTPEAEQADLAPVIAEQPASHGNLELERLLARFHELMHDPELPLAHSGVLMHGRSLFDDFGFWHLPRVRAAQIPAANGTFDARSLARLYAVLAEGGELDGVRLTSPSSIALFGTKTFSGPSALWEGLVSTDALESSELRYALGFEGDFGEAPQPWRFGPSIRAFGHLGAGGQIGFADPERRVSVAFVRNHHTDWTASTALVDALYGCL
jgi:CubicO group peptidase (beta-lactamase class C family)